MPTGKPHTGPERRKRGELFRTKFAFYEEIAKALEKPGSRVTPYYARGVKMHTVFPKAFGVKGRAAQGLQIRPIKGARYIGSVRIIREPDVDGNGGREYIHWYVPRREEDKSRTREHGDY